MPEKTFLNGKIIDATGAKVSASDGGLLYGVGLFETMRCNNGKIFCLDEHLDRLFASADKLSVNIGCDKKYLADAANQTVEANGGGDLRIRLTITTGSADKDGKLNPTILITAVRLSGYSQNLYKAGAMAALCDYRQNSKDPLTGHKTTSYFQRILALNEARSKKAVEALWFSTESRLAEGCVSNVFIVKDSIVYTPPADTPVLPGIARKNIVEIAEQNKIELKQQPLFIKDLLGADEVFISNVIMKVMPITSVEKHTVAGGKVGPITKKIADLFDELVNRKCGAE